MRFPGFCVECCLNFYLCARALFVFNMLFGTALDTLFVAHSSNYSSPSPMLGISHTVQLMKNKCMAFRPKPTNSESKE